MAKRKKTRRKTRKKTPPRKITCSNCGGEAHNARSCTEDSAQAGRHLLPHEVVVRGNYWAPYGTKGWSAVRVRGLGYKHAKIERVKPKTQEVVASKGKARRDELIRRDPKLVGVDRPTQTPDQLFAGFRKQRAAIEAEEEAKEKQMKVKQEKQAPEPTQDPKKEAEQTEHLTALINTISDDATDSDW